MLRDSLIAAIRTGVAAVAGLLVTYLVSLGVSLPEDFAANFTAVIFILATAGYNLVVGFLERKVNPIFGVLLGIPKAPVYGSVGTKTPTAKSTGAVDWALAVSQPDDKVPFELKSPEVQQQQQQAQQKEPVKRPRDEEGNTSVLGLGAALAVAGVLLGLFNAFSGIAYALVVIGIILIVVGAILAFVHRGSNAGV